MIKLINISNHPSTKWSDKQKEGFSEIIDIQFPNIDPNISTEEVNMLVDEFIDKIKETNSTNIMLMGEFTFCFLLQNKLRTRCNFWIPTTERKVTEVINPDGTVSKSTTFEFMRWRVI